MKQGFNKNAVEDFSDISMRLYDAAVAGDNNTLIAILKSHPDYIERNIGPGYTGSTILQTAAGHGHKDTVELLLKLGADIDNYHGLFGSAITRAVMSARADVVNLLLDKGAKINGTANQSQLLLVAINHLHPDMVKLLLDRGASLDTKGYDGEALLPYLQKTLARKLKGDNWPTEDNIGQAQVLKLGAEIKNIICQKQAANNNTRKNVRKNTP